MVEVVWTPFALEDLQSIYDYIAMDSPIMQIGLLTNLLTG